MKLGEEHPYFAVSGDKANRGKELNADRLEAFYRGGRTHVEAVLRVLKQHFSFEPCGRALDFGCGVGRLTCAMAPHFSEVVGLDVSAGMLAKAKYYCQGRGIRNIRHVNTSTGYAIPENKFDFAHTCIVLQHMRIREGEQAVRQIVRALQNGGVGAIHFTYGHVNGRLYHSLRELPKRNVITRAVGNILLGWRRDTPTMLMSGYSISRMLGILAESGIEKMFVHRIDDWGSLGLFLFFRKGPDAASEWSNPMRP